MRQQCGNQRGMLSLAGAGFSWGSAVGLDEWVANALDSLQRMLDKYGLVGLDINYEVRLQAALPWPAPWRYREWAWLRSPPVESCVMCQ